MQTWRKYFFLILLGCLLGCGKKEQGQTKDMPHAPGVEESMAMGMTCQERGPEDSGQFDSVVDCVACQDKAGKRVMCPEPRYTPYKSKPLKSGNRYEGNTFDGNESVLIAHPAPTKPSEGKRKQKGFTGSIGKHDHGWEESYYVVPGGGKKLDKPLIMGGDLGHIDPSAYAVNWPNAPDSESPCHADPATGIVFCRVPDFNGDICTGRCMTDVPNGSDKAHIEGFNPFDPQQLGEWIHKNCKPVGDEIRCSN